MSRLWVVPGNSRHPHLSKRARDCADPLVPATYLLQITENYISQAPLPSGFLVGSANGRPWWKTGRREKEAARDISHSTHPPYCGSFSMMLVPLGGPGIGPGNTSSSFYPFSLRIVLISYYWRSLSCLTSPVCLLGSSIPYGFNSLH